MSTHATLIEHSIGSAARCAACIVRVTGLPLSPLNYALPKLIGTLRVASILASCGVCARQRWCTRARRGQPQSRRCQDFGRMVPKGGLGLADIAFFRRVLEAAGKAAFTLSSRPSESRLVRRRDGMFVS